MWNRKKNNEMRLYQIKTIRNKCKENVSNDSNRHNISSDFCVHKIVTKERKWNQMTNKEKVLFYEKQLEKYAENGVKSRNNSNSMTSEIIEKARYSNKDITRHELNLVKRHLDLLKRKNRNVTKILTKPK